jgi:hypothetical protein
VSTTNSKPTISNSPVSVLVLAWLSGISSLKVPKIARILVAIYKIP